MKRGKLFTEEEIAQIWMLRRTLTVRQVAKELGISKTTVQQHCPESVAAIVRLLPVVDASATDSSAHATS